MVRLADKIQAAPLGKTHLFSVGQAGFIVKGAWSCLLISSSLSWTHI